MDKPDQGAREQGERVEARGYEPPRVERVLTPAELEREVLYAGDTSAQA